jgi:hypothetical protein
VDPAPTTQAAGQNGGIEKQEPQSSTHVCAALHAHRPVPVLNMHISHCRPPLPQEKLSRPGTQLYE